MFISHAHQDAEFAHRLAADLDSAGWRAWIAPESIQPGEKWVEAIGRGLDGSGVFVVALTPAAVASNWVKNETNAAIELDNRGEVQFIPLDLAACTVPTLWNVYQRVPFRGRYEDGLAALLRRLEASPAAPEAAVDEKELRRAQRILDMDRRRRQHHGRHCARHAPRTPAAGPRDRRAGGASADIWGCCVGNGDGHSAGACGGRRSDAD